MKKTHKRVSFSDFICFFAMSFRVLICFFATLRQVEFLTLQNPEQLFYCSGAYKNIKS